MIHKSKGSLNDRFCHINSEYIDIYELNEAKSLIENVFQRLDDNTLQSSKITTPGFCKDLALDKKTIKQLKVSVNELGELRKKLPT